MDFGVAGWFRKTEGLGAEVGKLGDHSGEPSGSESSMSRSEEASSIGWSEDRVRCAPGLMPRLDGSRSDSSSDDSAGVKTGGRGIWRDWEKKQVCLVVGEVRNGKVRGFYDAVSNERSQE